jgi:impB/mucB/samB family/impB/mucB/samB family C-terminal domain
MPQTANQRPTPKPTARGITLPERARSVSCAWVADLPSWAIKRLEPNLHDLPVVVLAGRRATGVCALARKAGVRVGDPLDRVRSLCPEAAIAQLEPSTLKAAWDAALEAMHRVTPWIETSRAGQAFLAGLSALDGEALAAELGLRLGVAGTRSTALLGALAAQDCGARFVKDEAAFLSRAPVYLLRGAGISAEVVERLELFGLKTLGDILLRVTPKQLEAQFGRDAALIAGFVSPQDAHPIGLYVPPASLRLEWSFETPVLEPFAWDPPLARLVARLAERLGGLLAGTVTVTLHTLLGDSAARQMMAHYTCDPKTLLNAATRCFKEAHAGLEIERVTLMLSDLLRPVLRQDNLFGTLERPDVRDAIRVVHQHFPDRIGKLAIIRPDAPLRRQRFRFAPLDGEVPRVKRVTTNKASTPKTKRSRKTL